MINYNSLEYLSHMPDSSWQNLQDRLEIGSTISDDGESQLQHSSMCLPDGFNLRYADVVIGIKDDRCYIGISDYVIYSGENATLRELAKPGLREFDSFDELKAFCRGLSDTRFTYTEKDIIVSPNKPPYEYMAYCDYQEEPTLISALAHLPYSELSLLRASLHSGSQGNPRVFSDIALSDDPDAPFVDVQIGTDFGGYYIAVDHPVDCTGSNDSIHRLMDGEKLFADSWEQLVDFCRSFDSESYTYSELTDEDKPDKAWWERSKLFGRRIRAGEASHE